MDAEWIEFGSGWEHLSASAGHAVRSMEFTVANGSLQTYHLLGAGVARSECQASRSEGSLPGCAPTIDRVPLPLGGVGVYRSARDNMHLEQIFRAEDVLVGFEAKDKWNAIERILDHFVVSESIPAGQRDALLDAVLHRERSMSTGMERGLAIPHAAVDGLERVVAGLAIVCDAGGLNFEGTDASPTRLVVLLLIPRSQKLQHIRTLAEIARVMSHDEVRAGLLEAVTAQEAWNVLTEGAASSS